MILLDVLTSAAPTLSGLFPLALPDPDPIRPPGIEQFLTIMGWLKWICLALCIIGLMMVGTMMAVKSKSGDGSDLAGKIGMVLAGVIVITAAGALVGFVAGA